jgi:hypothetical protein
MPYAWVGDLIRTAMTFGLGVFEEISIWGLPWGPKLTLAKTQTPSRWINRDGDRVMTEVVAGAGFEPTDLGRPVVSSRRHCLGTLCGLLT